VKLVAVCGRIVDVTLCRGLTVAAIDHEADARGCAGAATNAHANPLVDARLLEPTLDAAHQPRSVEARGPWLDIDCMRERVACVNRRLLTRIRLACRSGSRLAGLRGLSRLVRSLRRGGAGLGRAARWSYLPVVDGNAVWGSQWALAGGLCKCGRGWRRGEQERDEGAISP
jgi:hypothetical protein